MVFFPRYDLIRTLVHSWSSLEDDSKSNKPKAKPSVPRFWDASDVQSSVDTTGVRWQFRC